MDEQKAVEYLDSLKKRAFMTMNEVDLANLVIKYKKQIEQLQDDVDQAYSTASNYAKRFLKATKWINSHIETYTKNEISIIDWNTTSDPRVLLDILEGRKNENDDEVEIIEEKEDMSDLKWGEYVIKEDVKKCSQKDLRTYISLLMETQNKIIDKVNGEDNDQEDN